MGLAGVLIFVFGVGFWGLGVERANDAWKYSQEPNRYEWRCYKKVKEYGILRIAVPWPLRNGTFNRDIPGNMNTCTGEVYNGQWWYKPQGEK